MTTSRRRVSACWGADAVGVAVRTAAGEAAAPDRPAICSGRRCERQHSCQEEKVPVMAPAPSPQCNVTSWASRNACTFRGLQRPQGSQGPHPHQNLPLSATLKTVWTLYRALDGDSCTKTCIEANTKIAQLAVLTNTIQLGQDQSVGSLRRPMLAQSAAPRLLAY